MTETYPGDHDAPRPGAVTGGVVLDAFRSPRAVIEGKGGRRRQPASRVIDLMAQHDLPVLFDAMTHIATCAGVDKLEYYQTWDLWRPGRTIGALTTSHDRSDHTKRVLARQTELGVDPLAPIPSLESPIGSEATAALEMAEVAMSIGGPGTWLTVAGQPSFWSSGASLDGFVGRLAMLQPAGFLVSAVRSSADYPPSGLTPTEVAGFARTVRSLTISRPVVVSHGDFLGLAAVAAGADALGTGFDNKQRVLSPAAFIESEGRGPFRVTFPGLLAAITKLNAERLAEADAALAARLAWGDLPTSHPASFRRHFEILGELCTDLDSFKVDQERAYRLRHLLDAAAMEWEALAPLVTIAPGRSAWIDAFRQGVDLYIEGEGW